MVSICNSCVYASKCMRYCGRGLTTRLSECSGYMGGKSLERYWAPHPGSSFPLAGHAVVEYMPAYKVNGKDYTSRYQYYILNPDPVMGYLAGYLNRPWLVGAMFEYPSDDGLGWSIRTVYRGDGITKTTLIVERSEVLGLEYPVIPDTLWWLDPTLSHEESIPMYALLIAIGKYVPDDCPPPWRVLGEALRIGMHYKGRPVTEWAGAIRGGPIGGMPDGIPEDMVRLLDPYPLSKFWGERVYRDWVQVMNRLYEWVGKV